MKKQLLLLASALFCTGISIAQYRVSTDVETKNILLEEFTGIKCGNCPAAHKIAANLLLAQEGKFYTIAIHSGYYAQPSIDQPDFRTEEGEALDAYFVGNMGYPCGMINRHTFAGSQPIMSRSEWTLCAKAINEETAPVNLFAEAHYRASDNQLTVHIEGYYTADVEGGQNLLTVALLQNNIQGPQNGGGVGDEYIHRHMLRDFLTPLWGDTITGCTAGSYFSKDYTYTVPADYNGVAVKPADLEVVAYVAGDKTEVLNVTGTKPVCEGLELPLAAEISEYRIPVKGSYGFDFYELYLCNLSNDTLTAADFEITLNGTLLTASWKGNIAPLATSYIRIDVSQTQLIENSNDYSIRLTGLNGTPYEGNTIEGTFQAPNISTPTTLIELRTDLYADENTWCIKDSDGNVITTFGPYETGLRAVYNEQVSLEADRIYCFEVSDAWANGVESPRGYMKLYDDSNSLVAQQLEITGHGYRLFFDTSADSGIDSPAAANKAYSIGYDRNTRLISIRPQTGTDSYRVNVYSLTGAVVYSGTFAAGSPANIPAGTQGLYIIEVTDNHSRETSRIITY